jgi:uncharacterized protein YgbK (DUF1537 family)
MLLVLADDRTGALETAGAVADAGLRTLMVPFGTLRPPVPAECVVWDLGSRHLEPAAAAARAVAAAQGEGRLAVKLDSTLRGNWAEEVVAVQRSTGRAVLVVPANPAAGRTCAGGVVREHGVPVAAGPAGRDPRRPVRTSRPDELLLAAGADDVGAVTATTGSDGLARHSVNVADAATDRDLDLLGRLWRARRELVLAGTAAAIGAAARHVGDGRPATPPPIGPSSSVLVVSASRHPATGAQLDRLRALGWPVVVAGSPEPLPAAVRLVVAAPGALDGTLADGRAAELVGRTARRLLARRRFDIVMVMGGDTAAALLGAQAMAVGGTLALGVAWCRPVDAPDGPLILAKPGGFGGPDALAALFAARMSS